MISEEEATLIEVLMTTHFGLSATQIDQLAAYIIQNMAERGWQFRKAPEESGLRVT